MTYRERREARAERLRGWAVSNEAKAEAAVEGVHRIADGIPFGQPILVGHHSERHARRDQSRMETGMRSAIDHSDKAEAQSARADEIDRQAAHAIYSDDVDAVERLEERIAVLEAERGRIKAYNVSCRKGARDVALLDESQRAELVSVAQACPYPDRGQRVGAVVLAAEPGRQHHPTEEAAYAAARAGGERHRRQPARLRSPHVFEVRRHLPGLRGAVRAGLGDRLLPGDA